MSNNTLLLLHGESLEDSSNYGRVVTNNGVVVSSVQSKFGGKSLYFNGASYLTVPRLLSGNTPFTIEAWVYPTATKANTIWSHDGSNAAAVTGGALEFFTSNNVIYYCSGFLVQPGTSYAINTWHHVALVGDGASIKLFVDGTLNGAYSGTYSFCDAVEMFGANSDAIGSENFTGYMDEIRISNVARWSSNFTPPAAAYVVAAPGGGHLALVGGTVRDVTGGRCMVGGASYGIKGGRALVGGTSYAISFGPSVVTVTITSNGVQNTVLYATVAGTRYTAAAGGIEVMPGDQMTFGYGSILGLGGVGTGTLKIDGVTIGTLNNGRGGTYVWTVPEGVSAVTIALIGMPNSGSIEVTTS